MDADGRILYSTAEYGLRDEAAIYDYTFQLDGQVVVMNADGSNMRLLVDTMSEDSMPLYMPNEYLKKVKQEPSYKDYASTKLSTKPR